MTKNSYIEKYSEQVNLVQAAHAADISRAKLALDKGALVNLKDLSALRLTPLLCCILRHEPIDTKDDKEIQRRLNKIFSFADFLIEKGARITATCFEGYTYKQHSNNLKRKYNRLNVKNST